MALTQAITTSFKVELPQAIHDFTNTTGDVFFGALFKATASIVGTYGATTTNYSDMGTDELATAGGYTAGGVSITAALNITPLSSSTTAYFGFSGSTLTWAAATFTSRGLLIYNSSAANRAVCVLDFGSDKTVTAQTFTIVWPTNDSVSALIRIT